MKQAKCKVCKRFFGFYISGELNAYDFSGQEEYDKCYFNHDKRMLKL